MDECDVLTVMQSLESAFADLQECIIDELINKNINIKKFMQRLTLLPIRLRSEYQKIILEMLPTLQQQESISDIFLHLNPLFNFIDYHLLEHIIRLYGSHGLKRRMESYAYEVGSFMKQTNVQQLVAYWPLQISAQNLSRIGAKFPRSCSLHELNILRREMCISVRLSDVISAVVSFNFTHLASNIDIHKEEYSLTSFGYELKMKYQKTKVTTSHELMISPIKKIFKLAVIHKTQLSSFQPADNFVRKTITGKVDDIFNQKSPIPLENIFISDSNKCDQQQIVLIEGAPSSGKSSLAIHICQKWGKGELFEEFTLVILVQLGDPAVQRAQSISDFLPCQDIAAVQKLASEIVASNGRGVLWILDGWDKLPTHLRQDSIFRKLMPPKLNDEHYQFALQTKQSQNLTFKTPHYSLGMLCESSYIITSRPISSGDLHLVVSSRIELVGFSPEEQRQYFTECLEGDTECLKDLLEKIQDNSIVQSSCYIPLNAALTLHYFKFKDHSLPNTEYEMFATVIYNCIKHHLELEGKGHDLSLEPKSLGDLLSNRAVGEHFKRLCELAYNGVMQHKVNFSSNDLPEGSSTLGLLHQIDSFLEGGKSVFYRFFHHSLLEVLAAMHLATCLSDSEQASQFQQLFDHSHFVSVFRFYSAITKLRAPGMDDVIVKIASRNSKLQLVYLVRCLYETQNPSLCQFLTEHVRYLLLHEKSLSPLDCHSIGYFVSLSSSYVCSTSHLADLAHCQIGDNGVKLLTKFMRERSSPISHTQKMRPTRTLSSGWKLILSFNDIHEDGAASIAKVLGSGSCDIASLNLKGNPIGGRGLPFISKALITNTSLVELDLRHCSLVISEENGPILTEMLIKNKILRTLDLSDNKGIMLSDTGLSYIAKGLIANTTLLELDLSNCSLVISEENGPVLTDMLIKNKTLKRLDLSHNCMSDSNLYYIALGLARNSGLKELRVSDITAQGGKSLATAIATNASTALVRLDICNIEITKDSGPAFANMLQRNGSLEHISFNSSPSISDVGVSFIAEGLQNNATVKSLCVFNCNITSSGAKCLAEMLMINSSLTNLAVDDNPIRDEGVTNIAKSLKTNKTLKYLSMNSCEIMDIGVTSLTNSLQMNSSLRLLFLYRNRALTKEGIKPLFDVAFRKSVKAYVDDDLQQHSPSLKRSRYTGLEEKSK